MDNSASLPTFTDNIEESLSLSKWIFNTVQNYIQQRTLVIGANPLEFVSILIEAGMSVHVSDLTQKSHRILLQKSKETQNIREIHSIDFSNPNFEDNYVRLLCAFRTIIFFSFPHIQKHDISLLAKLNSLLKTGGCLVLVMPALTALYDGMELNLNDWKRIDWKPLSNLLTGFEILKTRYFQLKPNENSHTGFFSGYYMVTAAQKRNKSGISPINTFQ